MLFMILLTNKNFTKLKISVLMKILLFSALHAGARDFRYRLYCNKCGAEFAVKGKAADIKRNTLDPIAFIFLRNKDTEISHDKNEKTNLPIRNPVIRDHFLKELRTKSAKTFRDDRYEELSESDEIQGNMGYYVSKGSARKMRSQALKENDLSPSDFEDLIKRFDDESINDRYMRQVSSRPFRIVMARKKSINVLRALKELYGHLLVHVDATGGIVRKLYSTQKQILYHSMVVRLPRFNEKENGDIYAAVEMLTDSQTQNDISAMFDIHKMDSYQIYPLIDDVTTDYSWANLNALCLCFNGLSITQYLEMLHNIWSNQGDNVPNTLIHLCIAHLSKTFRDDVRKFYPDLKHIQINLQRMFCVFLFVRENTTYTSFLKMFIKLLMTKDKNSDSFEENISDIDQMCQSQDIEECMKSVTNGQDDIDQDLNNAQLETAEDLEIQNSIYARSSFFKEAMVLKEGVQDSPDSPEIITNEYYSPEFLDEFLKKYIAFAPLFININHPRQVY